MVVGKQVQVQVCVRLLLNHRSLGSKVHLDWIHQNISVVTNYFVSVNAKNSNNKNGVSHGNTSAVLDSSAQLQTIKKTEK